MALIYAVAMGAFAAMTPAFKGENKNHRLVYLVWYVVATVEAVAVVTISCSWRMLSFKKTHLMERMSLLTIIVIGEGAIGVTKTVARLMGKHGLDVEGCFLIMCIILLLVSCPISLAELEMNWNSYANAITHRSSSGHSTLTTSLTATTEPFASRYGPSYTSPSSSPS
jgi:low temperature requirement protein LtrA